MLSVQDVSFAYDDANNGERKVLEQFSMNVKRGSYVAVVGESGCGKSTLAKLLLGFYPVKSGSMSIGGKAYRNLMLNEIRQQIAYVPQEPLPLIPLTTIF